MFVSKRIISVQGKGEGDFFCRTQKKIASYLELRLRRNTYVERFAIVIVKCILFYEAIT